MSLIIQNLSDGSNQTVLTGGVATILLQAGTINSGPRAILAKASASIWTVEWAVVATVLTQVATRDPAIGGACVGDLVPAVNAYGAPAGDIFNLGTSGAGTYASFTPTAFIQFTSNLSPGDFYLALHLYGTGLEEYCTLLVRVLPAYGLPLVPALGWVPTDLIDLQADFTARTANSAVLSRTAGLKQGDDFTLAVVPTLAGGLITSGVTALSLTLIDRVNSPYAPLIFPATGTPPSLTEVGGNPAQQYYTVAGDLRDAGIATWFADLNARIDALVTANTSQPLPDRGRLEAIAQLHMTTADGITTTENFPFPILAAAEIIATVGVSAASVDAGVDLLWDLATNEVTAPGTVAAGATPAANAPLIYVKEQDDLLARLRLVKAGSALAPTVTACKLVLKELEPEGQIVVSDTSFATAGTGANFSVLLHAKFNGAILAGVLSNYEADTGTTFSALAEIELTFTNPFAVGPGSLVRTSRTFRIQVDRDLGEVA